MSLSACFIDPYSSVIILLCAGGLVFKLWRKEERFEFSRIGGLLLLMALAVSSIVVALFYNPLFVLIHNVLAGVLASTIPLCLLSVRDVSGINARALKARGRVLFKMPILGGLLFFTLINFNKAQWAAPSYVFLLSIGLLFLRSTTLGALYNRCYLGAIFVTLLGVIVRYHISDYGEIAYYLSSILIGGATFALTMINATSQTKLFGNQER